MKHRTVIILWIVALGLGLSVFLMKMATSAGDEDATQRSPGQTLLADFPAEKASEIEITGAQQVGDHRAGGARRGEREDRSRLDSVRAEPFDMLRTCLSKPCTFMLDAS